MLIHCKDVYNCSYIAREFRNRFIGVRNTRVLNCLSKALTVKRLSRQLHFEALGNVKNTRNLRHFSL